MKNIAPPQNISTSTDRPHDTNGKSLERRHTRGKHLTAEHKLRTLCHYQGMLIELQNERAGHGHA